MKEQKRPVHYQSKKTDRDVIDFCNDYSLNFNKGNIIKYTWRERMKGAKESLQKAAWYLERLIK